MRARDLLQACSWLPCLQEVDVQVVAQWDPACGVEAREQMNQKWQAMWQEVPAEAKIYLCEELLKIRHDLSFFFSKPFEMKDPE